MNTTTATRPQYDKYAHRTRRAFIWLQRAQSAYDLAARLNPAPTVDDVDAAARLLDSIQRYALADVREWEAANSSERYYNSTEHKRREKMLDARRARLQERLKPYRVHLDNYGLYPSIVDDSTRDTLHYLHYFD